MWVPLVYWDRIISLFLKVLYRLTYEVYLILLFIKLQRSKEWKFCPLVFFIGGKTTLKTQRHAVSMTPKNWEFREYSEPRKLSIFGRRIDLKLKRSIQTERVFSKRGIQRNINQEISIINETKSQAVLQ